MQPAQINDAVVSCLEHVASSSAPPAIAAADFLIRLLDDRVFPLHAVDQVAIRVGIILRGITERDMLNRDDLPEGWSCPQ